MLGPEVFPYFLNCNPLQDNFKASIFVRDCDSIKKTSFQFRLLLDTEICHPNNADNLNAGDFDIE